MVTLAGSFLTYVKSAINSSPNFYVEKPKFVNLYNYPVTHLFANQYLDCPLHARLRDHGLKPHKACGDDRGWSLDRDQQRRHFLDVVNDRIPLCGEKIPHQAGRGVLDKGGKSKAPKALPVNREDSVKAFSSVKRKDFAEDFSPDKRDVEEFTPVNRKNLAEDVSPDKRDVDKFSPVKGKDLAEDFSPDKRDVEVFSPVVMKSGKPTKMVEHPLVPEKYQQIDKDPCKEILDKTSKECQDMNDDSNVPNAPLESSTPVYSIHSILDQFKESKPRDPVKEDQIQSKESIPRVSLKSVRSLFEESKSLGSINDIQSIPEELMQHDSLEGGKNLLEESKLRDSLESIENLDGESKLPGSLGNVQNLFVESKSHGSLESVHENFQETQPHRSLDSVHDVFDDSQPLRFLSQPSDDKILRKPPDLDSQEDIKPKSKENMQDPTSTFPEKKKSDTKPKSKEIWKEPTSRVPEKQKSNAEIQSLTDELLVTLDENIVNLEKTFDTFIKKNKDFIQNILECLNHEKQKQKALEHSYSKLKHENDVLRTNNEYLKMVNAEQLKLFKNELDKAVSENKTAYTKKIQKMETQIQTHQDKLHNYKLIEVKYKEVIQKGDRKVSKLEDDVQKLKNVEATLLKNYVRILNFLEDVKKQLNPDGNKEDAHEKPSAIISDKDIDPELKGVMQSALTNGMESLNVRDLSILHDAIQDLNYHLCHSNAIHGIESPSKICNNYTGGHPVDYMNNDGQGYDTASNLSIYPSRQRTERY